MTEIEGEGEFLCLGCWAVIFPDDSSGVICDIVEVEEKDGETWKAAMHGKQCSSLIELAGFEMFKILVYFQEWLVELVFYEHITIYLRKA